MSGEPKMFRINPENRESEAIVEVEFAALGFQERRDIQEWIADNPGILGDDLLIIGKEFSGFDRTSERLDLLAVDLDGKLVIIELKRDDTGADAHWQAIKYASYLSRASKTNIVEMLADFTNVPEEESKIRLQEHLRSDDLNSLNNSQRIILASHRFAPEVTSAVLWLNEKAPEENLITCVQLVPYHDRQTDTLYIQASTIIPLPESEDFMVTVGDKMHKAQSLGSSSFGEKLSHTFQESIRHPSTPFFRRVGDLATYGLPSEIKPNNRSKWSGRGGGGMRYYHLWYSGWPWGNHRGMSYRVNLWPHEGSESWNADVEFWYEGYDFASNLADILLHEGQRIESHRLVATVGVDALNDDFGEKIATTVRQFIEEITPLVNAYVEEDNKEET